MEDSPRIDWIKTQLIPQLVTEGKFVNCKNMTESNQSADQSNTQVIRSIDCKLIPLSEAYMLTNCYKVKIVLANEYGEKSLHALVIKTTPENVEQEEFDSINFDTLFANEETAYKEILTHFEKADSYPKYFYSHRRNLDACIVLGDFTLDGWRMSKQLYNLSVEHCLLAAMELGRFHGEGYALKLTNPLVFNRIIGQFKESRYHTENINGVWEECIRSASKRVTDSVRSNTSNMNSTNAKIPEEFLTTLEYLYQNAYKYGKKIIEPIEPMATICHGDFLSNNIAFRYRKNDDGIKLPIAAMMFDFQTLRYGSPMIDLVTFMANSTGVDVRSTHFDEIFNMYHTHLIDIYCKKTGTNKDDDDFPQYLKYDSFIKEYAHYLPYGLSIASYFLCEMHEPNERSYFELSQLNLPTEYFVNLSMTKGGERVDRELCALAHECYELHKRFNLELIKF